MALQDITPRIWLLFFVGWGITILFIKGGHSLAQQEYRIAGACLILGIGLTSIFFRKRIIALLIIGLSFLLVNAGLTALFHPTTAGILLTAGSSVGLVLLCVWHNRKYPNLRRADWKKVFDNSLP